MHGILEEMTYKELQDRLDEAKGERNEWREKRRREIQDKKDKEQTHLKKLQAKILKSREAKLKKREQKKRQKEDLELLKKEREQEELREKTRHMKQKLRKIKEGREKERRDLQEIEKKLMKQKEYNDLGKGQIERKNNLTLQRGKGYKDQKDQRERIARKKAQENNRVKEHRNLCFEKTQKAEALLLQTTRDCQEYDLKFRETRDFLKEENEAKRVHNLNERDIELDSVAEIEEELFEEEDGLVEYFYDENHLMPKERGSNEMKTINSLLNMNLKHISF